MRASVGATPSTCPHSPYLVTLVCGAFAEVRGEPPAPASTSLYNGPQGREADIKRSLAPTPALIDHFSAKIGVPYPFRRYSQIFVSDFIFGGMENTTATTLTGEVILDPRAALDHDIDYLVAHELAHQWWGDLLHLPRLARSLAQRGLCHLLRICLARAFARPRRGRPRPARRTSTPSGRGPATTSGPSSAGNSKSPSTCSTGTSTRRAGASCTCCATSWAMPASGAPSSSTSNATLVARSKPAIWRASWRRPAVAT